MIKRSFIISHKCTFELNGKIDTNVQRNEMNIHGT